MSNVNSNNTIYNNLLPKIQTIYNKYNFLKISNTEFKKIVMEVIRDSKLKYSDDIEVEEKIIKDIEIVLFGIVKKRLEDNKKLVSLLSNYIDLNLDIKNDYDMIINEISKLTNFLRDFDIVPDPDIILELINSNEKFNILLKKLFDFCGSQDNKFDDELLNLIYDTFCLLNSNNSLISSNIDFDDSYNEISSYRLYMKDLELLDDFIITDEEEQEIFRNKTSEGMKRVVEKHLRLVPWYVNKYFKNREISFEDLIQEGNIGLIRAVQKYDINKGYKFSTYAVLWIRQAVTRALYLKSRTIKISVNKLVLISKMNKIINEFQNILGRVPNSLEIAQEMNITSEEVDFLNKIQQNIPISLNMTVGDGENTELGDLIPDDFNLEEDFLINDQFGKILLDIMDEFNYSERKKQIVMLRFGLFGNDMHTLEEIGLKLGISRQRTEQILKKIYEKLSSNYVFRENFALSINGRSKKKKEVSSSKKESDKENTKKSRRGSGGINIYDRLAKRLRVDCTPEFRQVINKLILELEEDKKNILIKRFGVNFDQVNYYDDWSKNNQKEVDSVLNYLFRLYVFLKNGGKKEEFDTPKCITLYERLAGIINVEDTSEFRKRIDIIISELDEKQKEIIVKGYGNDLAIFNRSSDWVWKTDAVELSKILAKIKVIYRTRYIGIMKSGYFIPFYNYFSKRLNIEDSNIFRLKIRKALLELSDNEYNLLIKIYGNYFTESNKYDDYSIEDINMRSIIIEKLVELLQCSQIDNHIFIDDYVGKNDYNTIYEACEMLPSFDKSIVKRLFGDNYDLEYSPDNVSLDEKNYFDSKVVSKLISNINFVKKLYNVKRLSRKD